MMYKEEKKQSPKNLLRILPWQIYTLVQDCQLEFSCVKQLSSTVKEFTVALFSIAFE